MGRLNGDSRVKTTTILKYLITGLILIVLQVGLIGADTFGYGSTVDMSSDNYIYILNNSEISLHNISDVNAPAPTDGQVLEWDAGTSKWVAATDDTGAGSTDTNCSDESCAEVFYWNNISVGNTNSSVYWNDTGTYNNTQMEVNEFTLTILESWLDAVMIALGFVKTSGGGDFYHDNYTDSFLNNMSEFTPTFNQTYNATYDSFKTNVSINHTKEVYDEWNDDWIGGNASWNESYANTIYVINGTDNIWEINVSNLTVDTFLTHEGGQPFHFHYENDDIHLDLPTIGGNNYFGIETTGGFFQLYANPNAGNDYLLATIAETQGADTDINFYEGGTGHNRFWDSGSMRVGGAKGYLCSELTSDVDCDTPTTGADLVVEDDIWAGGLIIAYNVTLNENMTLESYKSCTSLETDANGVLQCGSDASGSGGDFYHDNYTTSFLNNMSEFTPTFNSTYNVSYALFNETTTDTNCSDESCAEIFYWSNESIANTNSSVYWNDTGTYNNTQMKVSEFTLTILESWLDSVITALGYLKSSTGGNFYHDNFTTSFNNNLSEFTPTFNATFNATYDSFATNVSINYTLESMNTFINKTGTQIDFEDKNLTNIGILCLNTDCTSYFNDTCKVLSNGATTCEGD